MSDSKITVSLFKRAMVKLKTYITGVIPTSLPANGGNAETVNGHTVLSNVPANAKFTDTMYSLPAASSTTRGGVKIGYTESGRNYPVQLSNEKMFVNVPADGTKMNTVYPTGTGAISINRKADTTVGTYSVAMGWSSEASGNYSVAMGFVTKATGTQAVALGYGTASGDSSTAMGHSTASGHESTAMGRSAASGWGSTAMGENVTASNYASLAVGKYNKEMTAGGDEEDKIGDVFVIGNGTSVIKRSNAFRITFNGDVYGTKAYTSSGADYAEFIKPWFDNNPNGEDRVGYFVTVKDGKLRFAEPDDYIVGITSGNPSVVGNGDEDWLGRWERDEFNRIIMEDVEEMEAIEDEETGEITYKPTGKIIPNADFKENPEYDPSQKYIERKYRPEWDYVGMIGVLPLRDDGSCVAGGFAKCGEGGIATAADNYDCHKTFFVIERISDSVISVEMR